jgi:uncharacterized membrane protein YdbT with pleckstrin-like domain
MDLHADEHILYSRSPSWRGQFGAHLLALVVGIVLGAVVLLAVDPDWIGIAVGVAIAVAGTAYLWVVRSRTKHIITSLRLRVREGFVSKEVQETRLDRIQNVTTNQTVMQRLLRIGTVDYDTSGDDDGSRFRMESVPNPDALVRLVDRAQRDDLESDRRRTSASDAEAEAAFRSRGAGERPPADRA